MISIVLAWLCGAAFVALVWWQIARAERRRAQIPWPIDPDSEAFRAGMLHAADLVARARRDDPDVAAAAAVVREAANRGRAAR